MYDLLPLGTKLYGFSMTDIGWMRMTRYPPYDFKITSVMFVIKEIRIGRVYDREACDDEYDVEGEYNWYGIRNQYGPIDDCEITYIVDRLNAIYSDEFAVSPVNNYFVSHKIIAGLPYKLFGSQDELKAYANELKDAILKRYTDVGTVTIDIDGNIF